MIATLAGVAALGVVARVTMAMAMATEQTQQEQLVLGRSGPYDRHVLIHIDTATDQSVGEIVARVQRDVVHADVWGIDQCHHRTKDSACVVVLLPAEDVALVDALGLSYVVSQRNLQAEIDTEATRLARHHLQGIDYDDHKAWFSDYHPYEDILRWYQHVASKHPRLVRFVPSIGKSNEGRDLFAIHITSPENSTITTKKQIWLQSQIHAREWISGATVQYWVHYLLSHYGKDANVDAILHSTEFIIVPIVNPDGYAYTWTGNRLWRKNRRSNGRLFGHGVDLNRNFDAYWDSDGGASTSPFSEVYKGPSAESEPETRAIVSYFLKHPNIVAGIDFHSFSQLILRPNGYSRAASPHEKQHKYVGDQMRSLIKSVHGKDYTSIRSVDLYPTTGTASDWFYIGDKVRETMNQPVYGYTIELRPKGGGANGFILPPDQIVPTGEEVAEALVFFSKYVVENPLA